MAFPFVLQLIFGQPDVGISFHDDDSLNDGKLININIMNPPVNNRLLQLFRVSRMAAQDVSLNIKVFSAINKQPICETFAPEIAFSSSNKSNRISLPSSIVMTNVPVAKWQRATNSAVLLYGKRLLTLNDGLYIFDIRMIIDGRSIRIKRTGILHVGKTEPELAWDKEIIGHFYT